MYLHKIGATLDWAGLVKIGGRFPDLSGWKASAMIRGKNFAAPLAATLTFSNGKTALRLFAPPEKQRGWKPGEVAIDVRLADPEGRVLISPTALFKLEKPVTE